LEAVQAAPHRVGGAQAAGRGLVHELVEGDERVGVRAQRRRVLEAEQLLQLGVLAVAVVPLLAGDLAGAAADALGDVDQRRLDRDRFRGGLVVPGSHDALPRSPALAIVRSRTLTTFTRHAFVSCVPAPGSTASIVRWFTLGPFASPWKPQL